MFSPLLYALTNTCVHLRNTLKPEGISIGSNFIRSMRIWLNASSMTTDACRFNEYAGPLPTRTGFSPSTMHRQRVMCSRRFTWFGSSWNSPRGVFLLTAIRLNAYVWTRFMNQVFPHLKQRIRTPLNEGNLTPWLGCLPLSKRSLNPWTRMLC